MLRAGYVATCRAKALRERAHENIHVFRITSVKINNTTTVWTHGANTVRLVQIQIGLVLLFDLDNLGQTHNRTLHAVHALHNDKYLFPGSSRHRMTLDDGLLYFGFQVLGVVVLEHFNSWININDAEKRIIPARKCINDAWSCSQFQRT